MQFNLYQKLFFHSNLSEWPLGQGEPSMLGYGKIFTPNKACDLKWNEVPRTSMKDEAYLFILSEKFCLIKKRKRTHSNVFSVSEGHAAWVLPRLNGRARARVCVYAGLPDAGVAAKVANDGPVQKGAGAADFLPCACHFLHLCAALP